jgi:uncharacterized membrane protein YqgA involved in biofilm formation
LKFKAEICLLLMAIVLFAVSAFLYSYTLQPIAESLAAADASLPTYPYQSYAISFVGFGSLLMVTAALSFLRRSKTTCVDIRAKKLSEELR